MNRDAAFAPASGVGARQIWIIRHAQTEWSVNGRHTGRTDIPLTPSGVAAAEALKPWIQSVTFDRVLSSPLSRAIETARLCGLGGQVQVEPLLMEWDYGAYEGVTTHQIQERVPDWDLWRHGCPGGESLEQVATRARDLLRSIAATPGGVALFTHGHFARLIIAAWLQLPASRGRSFAIRAGSVTVLGLEHGNPVIWAAGDVPGTPGVGR
jgi:probable phosphoglycerate mutase